MKGLDTYNKIGQELAHVLKTEGFDFVARYFFTSSGFKEPFTVAEAKTLAIAGLKIVSIYENGSPNSRGYFTPDRAHFDALAALHQAKAVGQPTGTPIFFAVDCDAGASDVDYYFKVLSPVVMKAGYKVGVYGSGLICSRLDGNNLVAYTWLAQSKGWAGYSSWLAHADIIQEPTAKVHGLDVDTDHASPEFLSDFFWTPA